MSAVGAGEDLSQFREVRTIGASDARRMRAAAYADGRISRAEVERIARYHVDPSAIGERAPLFGNRGLFRA